MKYKLLWIFIAMLYITSCTPGTGHGKIIDVTEIPQPEPVSPELTLMVYMAADNDLESYALANLKEMEHAEFEGINILVLLDRAEGYDETNGNWTDTRLFEVVHDESSGSTLKSKRLNCPALGLSVSENTELDMANSSVLKNFVEFGKEAFPAEKYAVIIWGHGTGWRYSSVNTVRAVAIDDRTGTYMSVKDLGIALNNESLCVIGFDTCFGGVIENVYELKDCAEYTIASPGVTPSIGWDYKKLLESLVTEGFESLSIARTMAESSSTGTTVFINQKLPDLFTAFEDFSQALSNIITDSSSQLSVLNSLLNTKSYCYTQNPCDIYIDMFSMAEKYVNNSSLELSSSAANLIEIINQATLAETSMFNGIGVHFIPKSSSGALAAVHSVDYVKNSNRSDQCSFITQSQWWVPTQEGNSGSVLDKLFYRSF